MFPKYETFQYFINGGIFLSYLVESIHSVGLGSCIFQSHINSKNEQGLKALLNIPEYEVIIAIVGFGEPLENETCLYAQRKNISDIAIKK